MAEYLASIFGTKNDKVNCSFYFKIGACRHGEACSRLHNKPTSSQTILMQNLYQHTDGNLQMMSGGEQQEHYDTFFEDVFIELEEKYGEIEELNVCDNIGDHLIGNVYVKFRKEEDAEKAVLSLNNRWFNGQPIRAEFSPVTDFREACCRLYETGDCTRGGYCGFVHFKPISKYLSFKLYGQKIRSRSHSTEGKSRPYSRSPLIHSARSPRSYQHLSSSHSRYPRERDQSPPREKKTRQYRSLD
ncbi:Splicing factor U2AF 35 kDa subunit-like isoform X2 [Oopsacas minuta]|uniref:Splicing factor U2AF 35 kDa subunit-like isoform X2 n=1 Tax=Oopsacas minuta TaxID=111878 RepID=A0AAV7JKG1_9METZ|nr:Splicing factor U2AF 35 kDa subunit-like isoform X2 [Oopsacas minuta]